MPAAYPSNPARLAELAVMTLHHIALAVPEALDAVEIAVAELRGWDVNLRTQIEVVSPGVAVVA